jgi:catechol 2,3-dioxygenase-like lactoylglutathione lyase family enzyme
MPAKRLGGGVMKTEFIATVAVIAPDPPQSRNLYVDALGLPLVNEGDGYSHSETIRGCKSFGIWPLSQAARACFGIDRWPSERRVPQISIEFDVPSAEAVAPAAQDSPRPDMTCCTMHGRNLGARRLPDFSPPRAR